jgi:hypothetical protein
MTPANDDTSKAEQLERLTAICDAALLMMCELIGPNGMQARIAGRVLVAQLKSVGRGER